MSFQGKKINTEREDFAPKTYTKQEIRLKTPSSYGSEVSSDAVDLYIT
ncbi:MAG: hypothetical protein ACK5LL_14225 [Suipraeoptans sp.]